MKNYYIILSIFLVSFIENMNAITFNDTKNYTDLLNSTLINIIDIIDGFGEGLHA